MQFVAHNRFWSSQNVYATQNGGKYVFHLDETTGAAIPLEEQFWTDLFTNSSKWGLRVYEQDWLDREFEKLNVTQRSATLGRQWLLQMGRGASTAGMTIQYCMTYPRHMMQSVEIDAVTQARTSDDYHPNLNQWSLGVSSLFTHAMGIAPFKDTFWSSTDVQTGSPYGSLAEPAAELETLVAVLSMGPVGFSDKLGMANASRLMRTCDSDGRLLHPSRPATAIDGTFTQRSFGSFGPDGELWQTHALVNGWEWGVVLAAHLAMPFTLHADDLQFPTALGSVSYIMWPYEDVLSARAFGDLSFPALNKTSFQLWHLAPMLTSRYAVLGEFAKFMPISPSRFSSVNVRGEDIVLELKGGSGEVVTVAYYDKLESKTIVAPPCSLGLDGAGWLTLPGGTCASF